MVYRLRRTPALLTCLAVPTVGALVSMLLVRPWWLAEGLVAFFVVLGVRAYRRTRRRTLAVGDEGLTVQRDTYRVFVPWTAVESVSRVRRQLFLVVDELVARDSTVTPVDFRGRTTRLPQGFEHKPYGRRIHVTLYDKRWRQGPIGQRLAAHGVV